MSPNLIRYQQDDFQVAEFVSGRTFSGWHDQPLLQAHLNIPHEPGIEVRQNWLRNFNREPIDATNWTSGNRTKNTTPDDLEDLDRSNRRKTIERTEFSYEGQSAIVDELQREEESESIEDPDPIDIDYVIDRLKQWQEDGGRLEIDHRSSLRDLAEDTVDRVLSSSEETFSPEEILALLYSFEPSSEETKGRIGINLADFAHDGEYSDIPLERIDLEERNISLGTTEPQEEITFHELGREFEEFMAQFPHLFESAEDELSVNQQELIHRYMKTFLRHRFSRNSTPGH